MSNVFDDIGTPNNPARPIDMNIGPPSPLQETGIALGDWTLKIPEGPRLLLKTLDDRGAEYGEYTGMAHVAQSIKKVMRNAPSYSRMSDDQRESLDVIATKIARIVCGNPDNPDSWLDIEGYAKLVRDRIPGPGPATP